MTTLEGPSEKAERSLDRPVMTFDLPAILGSMRQETTWRTAKRNAMTLVKQPIFRVVLVALQAGAEVGAHEAFIKVEPFRVSLDDLGVGFIDADHLDIAFLSTSEDSTHMRVSEAGDDDAHRLLRRDGAHPNCRRGEDRQKK